MARARAIIVDDGRVALIERHNSLRGAHYFVFPGGGVEPGETAQKAARREVEEEPAFKYWLTATTMGHMMLLKGAYRLTL